MWVCRSRLLPRHPDGQLLYHTSRMPSPCAYLFTAAEARAGGPVAANHRPARVQQTSCRCFCKRPQAGKEEMVSSTPSSLGKQLGPPKKSGNIIGLGTMVQNRKEEFGQFHFISQNLSQSKGWLRHLLSICYIFTSPRKQTFPSWALSWSHGSMRTRIGKIPKASALLSLGLRFPSDASDIRVWGACETIMAKISTEQQNKGSSFQNWYCYVATQTSSHQ